MRTLTYPEPQSLPDAVKFDPVKIIIQPDSKQITVAYKFIAADDTEIPGPNGDTTRHWRCTDADFDAVFGFVIRTQDVGQTLGNGMWLLIKNRMKAAILKVANNDIS